MATQYGQGIKNRFCRVYLFVPDFRRGRDNKNALWISVKQKERFFTIFQNNYLVWYEKFYFYF